MVAPLGMIVSYAVLGGMPETDLFAAMRGNIEKSPAVRCFTMHTYDHMEEPRREAMARAVDLLGSGKVKPAIAARMPLAEARARARADRAAQRDGKDRAEAVSQPRCRNRVPNRVSHPARRHVPRNGGIDGNALAFLSRPGSRPGVLRVAGVSRRLFRPRLPGRRFLRRHPAGVPGFDHSLHRHPAAARAAARSASCAATSAPC